MRILKKVISFMFSRLFLVALMIVFQIALLAFLVLYFSRSIFYVYLLFNLISFFATIGVVSSQDAPSYKLTWAIAILVFPLIGGVFYLLFSRRSMPRPLRKRVEHTLERTHLHMPDNSLEQELFACTPHLSLQSRYIYNVTGYPLMANTQAEYFSLGDKVFPRLLQELHKAEHFIFLEFFIIRPGLFWDSVFEILEEKVREGVEVRLMYDDLGSIVTLPKRYNRMIRRAGIHLCVFNPFRPRINVMFNHRDHRKVVVIDGKTAFCGGFNLADEYINRYERYGHWKDTGVMLRGDAVWSFTFMFLQQWQFSTGEPLRYEDYHTAQEHLLPQNGLAQVFGDTPLDMVNVTETIYLHVIARATKYVYIATPYLVIDKEMENSLCSAAQSGVDVRIFTPHIYDKWYVHLLTRSHYDTLIKAGVRVYEYTPGFMHAKMFVVDDQVCMVGTCNMDFRSFYLHFECGVVFYHSDIVQKVKQDMLECQKLSHEMQLGETEQISIFRRLLRALLKVFAPLM